MAIKAYHGGAFFEAIGEDFSDLSRQHQIINADVLDSWFEPSPKAVAKIRENLEFTIRTSPPNYAAGLIKTIAEVRGVDTNNILVNGGSSDVIFNFVTRAVNKGDKVAILDPMYGEYQHVYETVCKANLVRFELHKEDNFKVFGDRFAKFIKNEKPSLVSIVNPNSPTGSYWDRDEVIQCLETVPKDVLFVVDETYIEYVDREKSLESYVKRFENLVIIKSMSKMYGLSGIRVGYLVASPKIIEKVSAFVPPWAVCLGGQIAAVEALKDDEYYDQKYALTHKMRNAMIAKLSEIECLKPYNSVGNFFMVELLEGALSASSLVKKLIEKNIYIRNCNSLSPRFEDNFVRIGIKPQKWNDIIVDAIRSAIGV